MAHISSKKSDSPKHEAALTLASLGAVMTTSAGGLLVAASSYSGWSGQAMVVLGMAFLLGGLSLVLLSTRGWWPTRSNSQVEEPPPSKRLPGFIKWLSVIALGVVIGGAGVPQILSRWPGARATPAPSTSAVQETPASTVQATTEPTLAATAPPTAEPTSPPTATIPPTVVPTPVPMALSWTFDTTSAVSSGPVIGDGVVVIGDSHGFVFGIDAENSSIAWQASLDDGPVSGLSTIGDSLVVFDDGIIQGWDAKTGRRRWQYGSGNVRIDEISGSAPNILGVMNADSVVGLDLVTGKPVWRVDAKEWSAYPVTSATTVYFTVRTGGQESTPEYELHAVDAATGRERWFRRFSEGSPELLGTDTDLLFLRGPDGVLEAIDHESGQSLWSLASNEWQGPAVAGDGVVALWAAGNTLQILDRSTGDARWNFPLQDHSRTHSRHAIANDVIFVGAFVSTDESGNVYAIDISEAAVLWHAKTAKSISSDIVVAGDLVYAGANDGSLYAYALDSGDVERLVTPGSIQSPPRIIDGAVYTTTREFAWRIDATTGVEHWKLPIGSEDSHIEPGDDGRVYVGTDDHVYAVEATSGAIQWQFLTASPVRDIVVGSNGKVYATDHVYLYEFDAATGTLGWRRGSSVNSRDSIVFLHDALFLNTRSAIEKLSLRNGIAQWTYRAEDAVIHDFMVLTDIIIVRSGAGVFALDIDNGNRIWSYSVPSSWYSPGREFVADGGTIYAAGSDGLHAINAVTGNGLWSQWDERDTFKPLIKGDVLFTATVDPELQTTRVYGLNTRNRIEQWTVEFPGRATMLAESETMLILETYTEDSYYTHWIRKSDGVIVSSIMASSYFPPVTTGDRTVFSRRGGAIVSYDQQRS